MTDNCSKYGDGSGLLEWKYGDTKRQAIKLRDTGNRYAIPALKALGLDITLEDVFSQIEDKNHGIGLYRQKHLSFIKHDVSTVESEMFSGYLNEKASEILRPIYNNSMQTDCKGLITTYGKYIVLDGGELQLNEEVLTNDHTKTLETDEEKRIWGIMCEICDLLNDLHNGETPGNWQDNFKLTPDGFKPETPIFVENFHK